MAAPYPRPALLWRVVSTASGGGGGGADDALTLSHAAVLWRLASRVLALSGRCGAQFEGRAAHGEGYSYVHTYAMRPDCALPTESGNWTAVQKELRTLQATIRDESGLLDAIRRWRSLLVRAPAPFR